MKCDDIIELILQDSVLSEKEQLHIERCGDCRALKEQMDALRDAGESERGRDLSEFTIASTLKAASEIQHARTAPPHIHLKEWRLLRWLATAAALVLLFGGGVMVVQKLFVSEEPGPAVIETAVNFDQRELDNERAELRVEVMSFSRRYRSGAKSSMDVRLDHLRARLAMASVGVERELAGL